MRSTSFVPAAFALAAALMFVPPPPAIADPVYAPAVREVTEQRTMTSRTYLNADGTYTEHVYLQPIHYKAQDGSWQPIDTRLTTSNKPGFATANTTNNMVWDTLAFHAEDRTVIFADDNGSVYGVGADADPNGNPNNYSGTPYAKWTSVQSVGTGTITRCSPLVAGTPGTDGLVFIGADDGYIHIFNAHTGDPVYSIGDYDTPVNGKIRSSLASYEGALYVLSTGTLDAQGHFATAPTLYCYR